MHRTAYTLQKGETRLDAGLVGFGGVSDFLVTLGATGGVTQRVELGANLAHGAVGVVNVTGKANLLDRRRAGLALSTGLLFGTPRTIWPLPPFVREELGNGRMLIWPTAVTASFPILPWFGVHADLGYRHVAFTGTFTGDAFYSEGAFSTRDLYFAPSVHFYIAERVALVFRAHLSAYAAFYSVVEGEYEVSPGVRAGITSSEWRRMPFSRTASGTGLVEIRLGRTTHLQVGVALGKPIPALSVSVLPAMNLYWRIGGPGHRERRKQPPVP